MGVYGNPAGSPYGQPYGSPGGVAQPGLAGPGFPYTALTPDVTMVPTTTNGPLPDRYGWIQRYEFGVMPFSPVKDGWDRFGEWAFDLGLKYVAPLYPIPAIFSFEQQYDLRLLTGPSSPPDTYARPIFRARSIGSAGTSSSKRPSPAPERRRRVQSVDRQRFSEELESRRVRLGRAGRISLHSVARGHVYLGGRLLGPPARTHPALGRNDLSPQSILAMGPDLPAGARELFICGMSSVSKPRSTRGSNTIRKPTKSTTPSSASETGWNSTIGEP